MVHHMLVEPHQEYWTHRNHQKIGLVDDLLLVVVIVVVRMVDLDHNSLVVVVVVVVGTHIVAEFPVHNKVVELDKKVVVDKIVGYHTWYFDVKEDNLVEIEVL